jgi:Holliday junction resolvasome RuvABC DNA-binding subunit
MKKVRQIIKEEVQLERDENLILVPGVGKMRADQLESELNRKLQDLMKRAKSKKYESLSASNMEIMLQYWFSLAALNKGEDLPKQVNLEIK